MSASCESCGETDGLCEDCGLCSDCCLCWGGPTERQIMNNADQPSQAELRADALRDYYELK